jgi:ubiquitin carboxyl-terminal hydrolase 6/32
VQLYPSLAVCFKIFDGDRDGVLNKSEIRVMVESMVEVRLQSLPAALTEEEGPPDEVELERMVEDILGKHDLQNRGVLTPEEFLVWTVDNPYPAEFSRLVFHLCHVVLGLRPLTRRDEGDVVTGWMNREERCSLVIGSIWHLVNHDWWNHWNAYVEHAGDASNSPR